MLRVPAARADVDRLAELPVSATVPNASAPDLNVTVPVAPVVTVAVNVTICPKLDGFGLEATVVLLALLPVTCCVKTAETLEASKVSPAYAAVMLWVPAVNLAVFRLAVPSLSLA